MCLSVQGGSLLLEISKNSVANFHEFNTAVSILKWPSAAFRRKAKGGEIWPSKGKGEKEAAACEGIRVSTWSSGIWEVWSDKCTDSRLVTHWFAVSSMRTHDEYPTHSAKTFGGRQLARMSWVCGGKGSTVPIDVFGTVFQLASRLVAIILLQGD